MQRYFVEPQNWHGETIVLTGQDAHHLQRVLRARVGERVVCSDGAGREALAEVVVLGGSGVQDSGASVQLRVVEWLAQDREPVIEVWVAQALPKGDKFETVLQKGTELGAARFIPFESERTVVQLDGKKEAKRLERWQKIIKEAAEQAHRGRVPTVDAPCSWREVLVRADEVDLALICYEKATAVSIRWALQAWTSSRQNLGASESEGTATTAIRQTPRVLVVVGPEGGFSEKEIDSAEVAGLQVITLGKRILRTETAALVALSCIFYESGDLE